MKKYYYSLQEVCNLLNVKSHILRYWEDNFPQLNSRTAKGRNRRYSIKDVNTARKIKDLLYNQKFTIEGARKKLKRKNEIIENNRLSFKEHSKKINEISEEIKKVQKLLSEVKQGD